MMWLGILFAILIVVVSPLGWIIADVIDPH